MEVFNPVYDKISLNDLSPELQALIKDSSESVSYNLSRHMKDKNAHINSLDREAWNNKAPNESPNFTGVPTSPTPTLGDSSNKIATTDFITNTLKIFKPEIAIKANRLTNKINIKLGGVADSTPVQFDGSGDLVIPVTTVDTSALRGVLGKDKLSGKYDISISGNANHADTADRIGGIELNELALKESPAFQGKPTAPTAVFGTATDQIATTKFVDKAIKALDLAAIAAGAGGTQTGTRFNPFKIKITGKATANEVTVDGTSDVNLNVRDLAIDYNEIANNLNITRVNGHTVGKDVPADAVFTDTVYVHPNTQTDLTATEFTAVTVDRQGHVIAGRNPSTLDVDITKNAASADKLKTARKFKFSGVTAADVSFDGTSDVTVNVTAIPANIITESEEKQFMSKAQKDKLAATLTATEIADKITEASSGMEWKEAVDTKSKISTRYPSPKKGWTVSVLDEGNTYQYNGSNWVVVSSSNMPKATTTADGKMSKEDKAKLDGIEAGANNYTLPATLPASMITQDDNHYFVTKYQNKKLQDLYNKGEMDTKFATKADLAKTDTVSLGNGWKILATNTGELSFTFNGVEKAKLGTDGAFKAVSLEETGGN